MFQVAEVTSIDSLETYRNAWDDLWSRGRIHECSRSFDWLKAAFPQPGRKLKVLVISLAGKVIGILPLVIKRQKTSLGELRVLTYPVDDLGNWYGPIGPNSAATLTAGLRYLASNARDWDLIDLPYVDRDRLDLGRTLTAARNMGWPVIERLWREIPVIHLDRSWTEFLSAKKKPLLAEIQQAEAALHTAGRVEFIRYRSATNGAPQRTHFESLLALWRELLWSTPEENRCERDEPLLRALNHHGQLDASVLLLNGVPVAGCFGEVHGTTVGVHRSATSVTQGLSRSPLPLHWIQSVLLSRILEEGLALGDTVYEVSPSCDLAAAARTLWSTAFLNSFRYTMAPWSNVRGALLVKYHGLRTVRIPRKTPAAISVPAAPAAANTPPRLRVVG